MDRQLEGVAADAPAGPDRSRRLRQALLEPLGHVHGVSSKVLSMALSDLLLGAGEERPLWIETGAGMIAIDSLVHNWLTRTGMLQRLGAAHSYGPGCYGVNGCAAIIEAGAAVDRCAAVQPVVSGAVSPHGAACDLAVLCGRRTRHLQRQPDR